KDLEGRKKYIVDTLGLSNEFQPVAKHNGASRRKRSIDNFEFQDEQRVVQIMSLQAQSQFPTDPAMFFSNLKQKLNFPTEWYWTPDKNAEIAASNLLDYVIKKKSHPNMKGHTVLGSLLVKLIPSVGAEDRKFLYELVVDYCLIDEKI